MRRLVCVLIAFSLFFSLYSEEDYHFDTYLRNSMYHIFDDNIHTLQLYCDAYEWKQPILELNSTEQLECSFDDFDGIAKDYRYTVVHCDPGWKQSTGVIQSDYMTGHYTEEYIRDYSQSFNTLRNYTHYSFKFPNDNINFSYSGNYVLIVYEESIDNPIFIARFYMFENTVNVPMSVGYSKMPGKMEYIQRVTFNIDYGSTIIREPYRSLYVTIQQNGRPFAEQGGVQPKSIANTMLYYDYDDKFEFEGNNEFRHIDTRSLKFLTPTTSEINVANSEYHVKTYGIEPMKNKTYQTIKDMDGNYQIYVYDMDNPDIEAEYSYVNMHVAGNVPMQGESLYICGNFNGWQMNEDNKMKYNYETGEYEINLYLKQGYYNYTFINKKDATGSLDGTFIDGSFMETQNRYSVYVYYQPSGERYCRLIGYNIVDTKSTFGN